MAPVQCSWHLLSLPWHLTMASYRGTMAATYFLLYWMEAPHPFTRSWHHALCASVRVAAGGSSNSSDWSGTYKYSGSIKDNALRCVCLSFFWLFYLVTPLFPGFGSGMYGVISLVSCTFVPCTHGPFLAWPCAFLSWPLPCVFLSALHAQHTAHFACNNLSANNWKI